MDETAIKYHYLRSSGYKSKEPPNTLKHLMADKTSTRDAKSHCTLVATVASDHLAQRKMPQLFAPNTTGRKKLWRAAKTAHSHLSNIHIDLETTGWMTNETMIKYLTLLADAVKELGRDKVVLVMDCHPAHLSVEILKIIKDLNWKVLFVPSKMTWLLQPLDVGMFRNLKRQLFLKQVENQISSSSGGVGFDLWVEGVISKVQNMFEECDGRTMFQQCGFCIPNNPMPKRIVPYMPMADLGCVRKLTQDELSSYIGYRCDRIYNLLFAESIPHERARNKIVVCTPTHRLSSKRSMSSMFM